ncbi:hypothetical protein HYQ45_013949 [Verticillium longisporum]|uniref:Uncharacterized protein n=1 Tax=Verticillium longisporum TaxID=100787 RepID=A0A8I2Z9P8_VERLO|nr:hypothetical protein HYQ45_013949 [Verticillium longisporum]
MRQSDAQKTWDESGAHTFLDGFIRTQGASRWLYHMDSKIAKDGQPESVLRCETLAGACGQPMEPSKSSRRQRTTGFVAPRVGAGYAPDGEPDTDSVTLGLATRLSHVFTTLDNSITDLLRLVFAGQESANGRAMTFEAVRAGDAPAHPVVQFFDGGAFLLDVIKAEASRLEQSFRGAITNVQRSLISGLGLRVYIVKDSSQDGGALCAETGSREFDGYCWFLYRPAGSQPWTAEPLGHDVVMAFHHWGIDMEQVYCNAEACRAAHGFEGRGAFFDGIGDSVYGGQDSFG